LECYQSIQYHYLRRVSNFIKITKHDVRLKRVDTNGQIMDTVAEAAKEASMTKRHITISSLKVRTTSTNPR
jgi:hypothetical protein